jgi:hypothetical protein
VPKLVLEEPYSPASVASRLIKPRAGRSGGKMPLGLQNTNAARLLSPPAVDSAGKKVKPLASSAGLLGSPLGKQQLPQLNDSCLDIVVSSAFLDDGDVTIRTPSKVAGTGSNMLASPFQGLKTGNSARAPFDLPACC